MSLRSLGTVLAVGALSVFAGDALAAAPIPAANYNIALMEQLTAAAHAPANAQYATTGTAFFISGSGDLLTVAHVVRDCDSIELISDNLPATRATVVKSNQGWDLAMLRLAEPMQTIPAGRTEMGDSGAPLLDSAGQVVGLLKGGYELRTSANPAENKGMSRSIGPSHNLVDAFYQELGMGEPPVAQTASSTTDTGSAAEIARSAVVRVVCWRSAPPN